MYRAFIYSEQLLRRLCEGVAASNYSRGLYKWIKLNVQYVGRTLNA